MGVLQSAIDEQAPEFRARIARGLARVEELERRLATARSMGPEEIKARHVKRGKMLVRDRVRRLLDPGADLLELSPLAAQGHYGGDVPAAGVVAGIGPIHGRPAMVLANDGTVKGGTFYPLSVAKQLRAQEIAARQRIPCVYLVDSGGAFLPLQSEIFPDRSHGGRVFYNQARMSAMGVLQIAVVLGLCTAGGAYTPEMCDEVIIVRGSGAIFLGGPPLVKAATGEVVSPDELGGADVHTRISGGADHLVTSEEEGIDLAREIVEHRGPGSARTRLADREIEERTTAADPLVGADAFLALLEPPYTGTLTAADIAARLADGSRWDAFDPSSPPAAHGSGPAPSATALGPDGHEGVFAGWTSLGGVRCGLVLATGRCAERDLTRAQTMAQACASARRPLVTLALAPQVEETGASIRACAQLVQSTACLTADHVAVELAPGTGIGREILGGRGSAPGFLFRWPHAGTGGCDPFAASAIVADDGIIDPRATRTTLAAVLRMRA